MVARSGARAEVFPRPSPRKSGIYQGEPGADVARSPNTVRPAKGYVFPQREVLYRFRQESGKAPQITETLPADAPAVVFGVRPCDGRAMVRNDKVFACGFSDPYYKARRDKVVFVGLACAAPPSPNCFCLSVGGSPHARTASTC